MPHRLITNTLNSREFYGEEWTTFTLKEIRELDTIYTHPTTDLAGSNTPQHESPHADRTAAVKTLPARYSTTAFHSEETIVVPPQPPTPPATQEAPSTTVKKPDTSETSVSDAQASSTVAGEDGSATGRGHAQSSADPNITAPRGCSAPTTITIASTESVAAPHTAAPGASMSLADRQAAALEELLKQTRRYNIDMCPRACLSRGALIQLLITSNIGRYLEFKAVAETYIRMGQENREVRRPLPSSLGTLQIELISFFQILSLHHLLIITIEILTTVYVVCIGISNLFPFKFHFFTISYTLWATHASRVYHPTSYPWS